VVCVPVPKACIRLHNVHPQAEQVGTGRGSAVRTRVGRGPRFQTLALVGNRTEQAYVVNVLSGCFKSRSCVAGPVLLLLLVRRHSSHAGA
jgi:hypothetical protein